jgi:hypothetical protein
MTTATAKNSQPTVSIWGSRSGRRASCKSDKLRKESAGSFVSSLEKMGGGVLLDSALHQIGSQNTHELNS